MAYRYHGRAKVDPENPQAWGICDRTGFLYNLADLQWQHDWRGQTLQNLRLLVREQSVDTPSPWFKTVILPPDPPPVINARVEPYAIDETNWLTTEGTAGDTTVSIITDESGANQIVDEGSTYQPLSEPQP